jgi:hypothetical protein
MKSHNGLPIVTIDTLDDFTRAYLECALWSSNDGDRPLDANYGLFDFSPEALEQAAEDCAEFQAANAAAIEGREGDAGERAAGRGLHERLREWVGVCSLPRAGRQRDGQQVTLR